MTESTTSAPSAEERLERLESLEAIRRVEAAYCDHWDNTRPEQWAGVFTPDGVFRRADVPGVPGHVQRGRVALAEFCRTLQVGYGRFHLLNTVDISLEGEDAAVSRIGFQCVMTSTGDYPRASLVTGYYDTRYRRLDSRWFIDVRVERQVFRDDRAYYGVADPAMPLSSVPFSGVETLVGEGPFDDAR